MGNCLKTQLKESVNNNSLLKVGEMLIKANLVNSVSGIVFNGMDCSLSIITDGYKFTQGGEQKSTINGSATSFSAPAGQYDIVLSGKYNIVAFENCPFNFNIDELKYSNSINTFYTTTANTELSGNISSIAGVTVQMIGRKNGLVGTVADIKATRAFEARSINVTGNIADLASLPIVPTMLKNINNSVRLTGCGIEGTIEELVSSLKTAGYSSGAIHLNVTETAVKFGTYSLPGNVVSMLEWDANTILMYIGASGQNYRDKVNGIIYAKGFSAEQISTWEETNTVYVVS